MSKQHDTRKLAYEILFHTNVCKQHAGYFLQQHVLPDSQLQTDGAGIYKAIDQWWPVRHRRDLHKKWEFELTAEIEGVFGNLRTFIRRMYHLPAKKNSQIM